ncbi:RNA-directed DNA polymerase, eukaryota [Tanacetum coccineum]
MLQQQRTSRISQPQWDLRIYGSFVINMERFDRKPNAIPKSIPKPSNNHPSNQPKSASFPSHANPNRSYATALNGKTPQNFESKERSILKSVTLDATDLLDTSDMRNVILAKGEPLFVDEDPHDNVAMGRVCIKTKIQGQITETCKVVIHGKPHNMWVKEFAGWVPDIKTMESLLSENSKTDNSDNHDHDIDDNGFHDIEEGEIRNMNVNQEEEVVKDTQWSVGVEQIDKDQVDSPINNMESHKQPTKETREIQKEDSESISKPSGFEGSKNDLKKFIDSLGAKQGIQETHSLKIDSFKAKSLWGNFQFDYAVCPSSGRSGGLVSIWDPNVFIIFPSENLLIVEGVWTSSHLQCFMINVYAPQEDRKKETLWHNILDFKDCNPGHYFIFGDFNVVRYTSERIGTAFNPNSANAFNQFIRDGHLWDIPLGGHLFTRINNRGDKLSKLDRFLITENSASLMHNYSAQVFDCHISYHRPLILSPSSLDFGPIPFKFYNSWLLDKNLYDIVAKFWEHHVSENGSNLIVSFKNKMKALKPIIKGWSKNRSSSQSRDKEDLIRKIKDFDDNIASGTGDVMVGSQRSIWLSNLRRLELEENLDFSQKAKIKWGIEADENSKFFHAIVNQKRRYLSIHGIKHEGQWISEPHRIKAVFYSFFVTKFQRKNVVKIVNRSPFYKSLHEDKNSFLVSTVNETEIRDAIWDCGSKKSSGPDGFTFAFYKKFWDMLKEEAVGFVQDFFNTGTLPHGCNTSFIVLILKVPNPMVMSDFFPISLIIAQYKIIAKVLANRLARVIDSVISQEQSAFIQNR